MSNTHNTHRNEPLLLRGTEVAELIGCSRALAYRLMQRGVIPVVRVPGGKTVRVPAEALREWIKANTEAAPLVPSASKLR
jgi:excisionase family DNA binding protein